MAPDSGSPPLADPERQTRSRVQRRRALLAGLGLLAAIALLLLYKHNASVTAENQRRSDASRPIPVRTATAVTGSVPRQVVALGTVTALNTVTVRSRVDGPLIEVPFSEGQLVKGGELLARIDPRTFQVALEQAAGQLAHDQAQLADARIDLDRYTGLLAKDSIAKQQVDSQLYTVRQLEGTVRSDQAQVDNARLQLEFTRISAPFAGRVGLRQIDPGNMIHSTDTNGLVVLTQTEPITVIFAVPSSQLAQILPRWHARQDLPVDALDRDGKVLAQGQLTAIDNQIDVATGTVKLKALFPNHDDSLFPSQFVNARLTIETLNGQTLVPSAAIQRGAPGTFVYVVATDNTVSLRPVTPGPASGEQISIAKGIKPGERVVIDGLDKLRDGSHVTVAQGSASKTPGTTQAATPHKGTGGKASP